MRTPSQHRQIDFIERYPFHEEQLFSFYVLDIKLSLKDERGKWRNCCQWESKLKEKKLFTLPF